MTGTGRRLKRFAGQLCVCLLLASCASAGDGQVSQDADLSIESVQQTTDDLMPYIPAALMEDLAVLQSAIFYKYEEAMSSCMRARGWEYAEPVLEMATAPVYQSQGEQLLADLTAQRDGIPEVDGQTQEMTTAASEQEQADFDDCFDTNEWKVSHPLAEGSDWLAEAYDSADERTKADESWQASFAAANECFEDEGHGTSTEILQVLDDEYVDIAMRVYAEEKPSNQLIAELEELVDQTMSIDELTDRCFASHRERSTNLYYGFLSDEVTGTPELQAEIAAMQATVDRYRDVLDELNETTDE